MSGEFRRTVYGREKGESMKRIDGGRRYGGRGLGKK